MSVKVLKEFFKVPLAERVRPQSLEEYVGQSELVDQGSLLVKMIEEDSLSSFILWGPPGTGKTSLAHIISKATESEFLSFSAVTSSIKDVKAIMSNAELQFKSGGQKCVVFIDEIHRFNKAQQDAFLSFVEQGAVILIGATTENPSFSVISPLLSRMRVFTLRQHSDEELFSIASRAVETISLETELALNLDENLLYKMVSISSGDARRCLGLIELAVKQSRATDGAITISEETVKKVLQGRLPSYDKTGDYHFDYLSALHKSMRNSDVDAACYYAVKMLESGEDPQVVMRRVIQCSAEDIGLADPNALTQAMAARDSLMALGMPESRFAILQAVAYNALAPKSNALYTAYQKIAVDIKRYPDLQVPLQIRNAPTKLMKELNYGKGYQYAHDNEIPLTGMQCLPDELKERRYYEPKPIGFEKTLKERKEKIEQIKRQMGDS